MPDWKTCVEPKKAWRGFALGCLLQGGRGIGNRGAMQIAHLVGGIAPGAMHRRAIVPHHQVIRPRFDRTLLKIQALSVGSAQGAPGTVLGASAEGIEVACGEGSVVFTSLQPEGKKPMTAQQFLAGRKVTVGDRPFGEVILESHASC